MVPTFFRDFAETANNSIPLATRTGLTFDQLTDMLRQRYVPEDSAEFYGNQLHGRDQKPGEKVLTYALDIQKLAAQAYPDADNDMLDSLTRRFFIAGLNNDIWPI